jgi:nucleotide sugar dehydrogenase
MKKICIFGMGYVGQTLSVILAEAGFKILGIERNLKIIKSINSFKSHIYEPGLNQRLKKIIISNKLKVKEELKKDDSCNVYIITVGTPFDQKKKKTNLKMIKSVANDISSHLKNGDLIILRSTVIIGTTEGIIVPILNKSNKKYHISFCPERTIEGKALKELRYLPQIIGSCDKKSYLMSKKIFNKITTKIVNVSNIKTAETIKVIDNVQRDIKFSISNEIAMICDSLKINAHDIIKYGKLNYPRSDLFMPGPVGGPCLEKDTFLLAESSKNIKAELSLKARSVNLKILNFISNVIKKILKSKRIKVNKIVICGVAFKGIPETNDIRGTTARYLINNLKKLYNDAVIYGFDYKLEDDSYTNLGVQRCKTLKDVFIGTDLLIFHNNNIKFSKINLNSMSMYMSRRSLIYDMWNNFNYKMLNLKKNISYCSFGNLVNLK